MSPRRRVKKKAPRVRPDVRTLVATWLRTPGRLRHGQRQRLARALGVTERLLRHWASRPTPPRVGRPPHPAALRWRAALAAARQLKHQGWSAGWRPVAAARPHVPVYLLKTLVPALKRRHRARLRRWRAQHRVTVHVHAPGVIVGQDAVHLGGPRRAPRLSEVLRDRATCAILGGAEGPPSTGAEVVQFLQHIDAAHGLPLVEATDNGAAYRSAEVQTYLASRQVVWLPSRVHTPQDNGATERAIRELEDELDPDGPADAEALAAAATRLNTARRRGSRGFRTAAQLTHDLPPWYGHVDRTVFYAAAMQAIAAAEAGAPSARQARAARREATFRTLEQFGLVTRTRGGAPLAPSEPEILS